MLKIIGNALNRIMGVIGGFVWAVVISLAAFHAHRTFGYHTAWMLGPLILSLLVLPSLGFVRYRYFGLFGMLAFVFFTDSEQDDIGWREWLLGACLFLGLIALVAGTVFHSHFLFGAGVCGFVTFAVRGPSEFRRYLPH